MINLDDRLIKETLPKIKPNALAVLLSIAIHLNKKSGRCFPSHRRLMELTGLGRDAVYSALEVLKKEGLLKSNQEIDSKTKSFGRRTFSVSTRFISIFVMAEDSDPLPENPDTAHPDTAHPDTAHPETKQLNEVERLNKLEQLNEVGVPNTPAPEFQTLKEKEVKRGMVAPPAEAAAPTHIVTTVDPAEPGLKVVAPFTMPKRVDTVDEAEQVIMEWATGDGRESVRKWYADAARQCTLVDVTEMVSKFASVYLTIGDEGKRQRMAQDPLQFFKYTFKAFLKTEKSFGVKQMTAQAAQQTPPANYTSQTRH